MKKLLIVLIVAAAGIQVWYRHLKAQEDNWVPEAIANPVYLEVRVEFDAPGRSAEGVMYLQALDQEDCEKQRQIAQRYLYKGQAAVCPIQCKIQKTECKAELAPRYSKLFDNAPTSVTYISYARGQASEREIRLIYWGVTVDESDRLCGAVSTLQEKHKGLVRCIPTNKG